MKILAINPGSTSTKIGVFQDNTELFKQTVVHDSNKLATYPSVCDQLPYRVETILSVCQEQGVNLAECDAFVGRGGGLNACAGGTYAVSDVMLGHATRGGGNHPAALGSQIANQFAQQYGKPAFVVNPPDVDEFCDEARITGLADVFRTPSSHALNQKETAIRVAHDLGKTYETCNFVVCHIGGGVSITAHRMGQMIDSNGIINGEGPMAPTRSGALPAAEVVDLCFSGKYTKEDMNKRITKSGGFVDHLGTSEAIEVGQLAAGGNAYAKLVYDAFQYQIAKEVGAMAAVLCGKVDAIILTGGISHDKGLCQRMRDMVGFIAPIQVRAGEFEMEALAAGALRVLRGEETAKIYTGEPVFSGFDHLK